MPGRLKSIKPSTSGKKRLYTKRELHDVTVPVREFSKFKKELLEADKESGAGFFSKKTSKVKQRKLMGDIDELAKTKGGLRYGDLRRFFAEEIFEGKLSTTDIKRFKKFAKAYFGPSALKITKRRDLLNKFGVKNDKKDLVIKSKANEIGRQYSLGGSKNAYEGNSVEKQTDDRIKEIMERGRKGAEGEDPYKGLSEGSKGDSDFRQTGNLGGDVSSSSKGSSYSVLSGLK